MVHLPINLPNKSSNKNVGKYTSPMVSYGDEWMHDPDNKTHTFPTFPPWGWLPAFDHWWPAICWTFNDASLGGCVVAKQLSIHGFHAGVPWLLSRRFTWNGSTWWCRPFQLNGWLWKKLYEPNLNAWKIVGNMQRSEFSGTFSYRNWDNWGCNLNM